jgi:hypothetical protein
VCWRLASNSKSEARSRRAGTKQARSSKFETHDGTRFRIIPSVLRFVLRICFEFRISTFGFFPHPDDAHNINKTLPLKDQAECVAPISRCRIGTSGSRQRQEVVDKIRGRSQEFALSQKPLAVTPPGHGGRVRVTLRPVFGVWRASNRTSACGRPRGWRAACEQLHRCYTGSREPTRRRKPYSWCCDGRCPTCSR